MLDRFDLYELTVQSPRHVSAFLRGVHPGRPVVLREDFCGTAAVARRWIEDARRLGESARAVGVDSDPDAIARARDAAQRDGSAASITFNFIDCLAAGHGRDDACDVAFVGNFSIGYLHDRGTLVQYLKATCARLSLGNSGFGGGVFVCDTYGGASAFKLGGFERRHPSRGREVIHYIWNHDKADPTTSMVENSISFRVEVDGEIVAELPRAFTYHWRLWSIAELREAMLEAGFARSEVYTDVNIAPGQRPHAVEPDEDGVCRLGDDWIVLIAAFLE